MNHKQIEIVSLQQENCEEVYELAKSRIPEHWSLQGVCDVLKYDNNMYYVAKEVNTQKVLGFGGIMIIADEAELLNIAVREEYSRMGIASLLLEKLMEDARKHSVYRMLLEVRKGNVSAQKLYDKYHFSVVGERKGYYSNPKEDALIMERLF